MKFILILLILTTVSAANIRTGRKTVSKENVVCSKSEHPACLTWDNKTQTCYSIDCWKYDSVKEECQKDGKPFTPAIILQAIPFTGAFGSGFGNMGRWDIFSTYMIVVFGPLVLVALIMCCCVGWDVNNDDKTAMMMCCIQCLACLWAITIMVLWIWGIVVIASKEVEAPWTDHAGNSIMCPLV